MMRVVLLSCFAAALASAQIIGRVTDPSGSAVPESRVFAVQRATTATAITITDNRGQYSFTGLPPGEWLVEARAAGFGSSKPVDVEVKAGEPREVDLGLELQRVSTQVQVTASGGAQPVDEQAKALTV